MLAQPFGSRREETGWLFCSGSRPRTACRPSRRRYRALSPIGGTGDTIPLGPRTLRVVDIRDDDAEQPSVLVVEDLAG
jgi:hypothetical protein